MPIFKTKLESLIEDAKKIAEKAKKLTPEEYEQFRANTDKLYDVVDEVADEAKDQVEHEEVHDDVPPVDEVHEGDPEVKEETPEEPNPIPEPAVPEYDAKKDIDELKEVLKAQSDKIIALEEKLSKYEGFGDAEHQGNEHKDVVIKGETYKDLMAKYFGH